MPRARTAVLAIFFHAMHAVYLPDGGQDLGHQLPLEVLRELPAIAETHKYQIVARYDVAVVVEGACRLHQVFRTTLVPRENPPLGAVVGLDLLAFPGEFVVLRRRQPFARPFTLVQSQPKE